MAIFLPSANRRYSNSSPRFGASERWRTTASPHDARIKKNRAAAIANAKMVPPQNVARIVVSFPASRRRSPTAFMRAPETSGATIKLRPGSRLGGRSLCGKMNALMTPHIEPMTAQPSIARTGFALRVPRSACARLSQPRVNTNSPSTWTTSSKSSSKRISSKARHLEKIGTAVGISERDGDGHLATQGRIFRLELVHFDDPLVRHELHEAAAIRVGVSGRLAGPGRHVVLRERRTHARGRSCQWAPSRWLPRVDREVRDRRSRGALLCADEIPYVEPPAPLRSETHSSRPQISGDEHACALQQALRHPQKVCEQRQIDGDGRVRRGETLPRGLDAIEAIDDPGVTLTGHSSSVSPRLSPSSM